MTTAVADPFTEPEVVDPEPVVDPTVSDDAPFGMNPKTGKPFTISPEARERRGRIMSAGRAAARKRPTAGKKTATKGPARAPNYADQARALMTIPTFACGVLGQFFPSFALDAMTIHHHAEPLAEAMATAALEWPTFAAWLERATAISPGAVMFAVAIPFLGQLAANHGIIKPNPGAGILDAEGLMTAVGADAPPA